MGAFLLGASSGLGVYTREVLRGLAQSTVGKHDLAVYASDLGTISNKVRSSIELHKLPAVLSPSLKTKAALARALWLQIALPNLLSPADVFYSPTHHGMSRGHCRQVITIHDLLPLRFPSQYRLQHFYFVHRLPKIVAHSSAVIVDSESTRHDVHQFYGVSLDKLHVVHAAVDQNGIASPECHEVVRRKYDLNEFILMVGASYPHKNIDRAIEAFAAVSVRHRSVHLVIAGGRPKYLNFLKSRVRDLKLERVRFLGYVSREELWSLYACAKVLLYPSLYEGFGLPPLEAMVSGCPVITSNISSLPEVCGSAAYYVDPCYTQDLETALTRVLSDEGLRRRLQQEGFTQVKQFSWDRTAGQILEVLHLVGKA